MGNDFANKDSGPHAYGSGSRLVDRRWFIRSVAASAAMLHAGVASSAPAVIADPRKFGARGAGASFDDGVAIQAAIDHLWRLGGGTVRFAAVPSYYNITQPIICRPGVSLQGDGSFPTIRTDRPDVSLLLAGNFHPDFVSRAHFDPVITLGSDRRAITLTPEDRQRYKVGDQLFIASRSWGKTDGFPIPYYGWLNVVLSISGDQLLLQEPVDIDLPLEVTRLADTPGRNGVPLFFYSDANISGLRFQAIRHLMGDSALLRVSVSDNRVFARTGIYGNCFQYVKWEGNHFIFTHAAGEQSLNSLHTVATGNKFYFRPGRSELISSGFYFQEYARDIVMIDNSIDVGDFTGHGFLISITSAKDVKISRLDATGTQMHNLIYIGSPGSQLFEVSGNEIVDSHFSVQHCDRFIFINGYASRWMHDNRILRCRFEGTAGASDGVRVQGVRGNFGLQGNLWRQNPHCALMQQSQNWRIGSNFLENSASSVACEKIS